MKVKEWWKKNGTYVGLGLVVFTACTTTYYLGHSNGVKRGVDATLDILKEHVEKVKAATETVGLPEDGLAIKDLGKLGQHILEHTNNTFLTEDTIVKSFDIGYDDYKVMDII